MRIKLMIIVWIGMDWMGYPFNKMNTFFRKPMDRQHFPMAQINNRIENYSYQIETIVKACLGFSLI